MTVRILNTHTDGEVGEYCGRGSPLGNPHPKEQVGGRDNACDLYEQTFRAWVKAGKPDVMAELHRLRALYEQNGYLEIRCFCFPKRCHLITVRDWIVDNAFQDDAHFY